MSYFHPRRAFGNEDVIYKARQYENALQERVQFVHNYETLMRYAQFEQSNGPRSSHRSLADRLAAMREEREQALLQRRHKLSSLLTAEDAILQNEIKTGNMNLSQRRAWLLSHALSLSHQTVPNSNLEKALSHDYDQVSMHNSKLAIHRTEAERKRHNADIQDQSQGLGYGNSDAGDYLQAVDILRQHLPMVEHLRDAEKAAVEEDMVSMHRAWLGEEEALKLKQLERRHHDSVQAQDLLLNCKEKEKGSARESNQDHIAAMAADKEREEERQLEELREAHKREALAYVSQLKAAAERQQMEDKELQATIKAMVSRHAVDGKSGSIHEPHSYPGIAKSTTAHIDDGQILSDASRLHDTSRERAISSELSKRDLVDVLESERRGCHAAQLVDQQVSTCANSVQGEKANEIRMKQTLSSTATDLPYPEPYYGRKAVNWYQ